MCQTSSMHGLQKTLIGKEMMDFKGVLANLIKNTWKTDISFKFPQHELNSPEVINSVNGRIIQARNGTKADEAWY